MSTIITLYSSRLPALRLFDKSVEIIESLDRRGGGVGPRLAEDETTPPHPTYHSSHVITSDWMKGAG